MESSLGYKDSIFKLPALFYVDDGLLLAQSKEEANMFLNETEII